MPAANETNATSNVEREPGNEPESNFLLSGIGGTLRSGLSEPSDKEKQRRNYERKILENRFDAYMPTWLSFGAWSVDEACRLLAGIPIRPIARVSDLEDRAHLTRKSNYRRLLLVAGTYKKLADGATPAEWIDWFNTSGVAKQVSNAPRIAEPLSAPDKAAPPAPVVTMPAAPLPRQRHQENEILRVIAELGYSASALPKAPPGKKGPKHEVRAKIGKEMSVGIFDLAWERLRSREDIQDAK